MPELLDFDDLEVATIEVVPADSLVGGGHGTVEYGASSQYCNTYPPGCSTSCYAPENPHPDLTD